MLRIPLAFALALSLQVHEASADVERVLESGVQQYQIRLPANTVDLAPSSGVLSASRLGAMTMTLSRIDGNNIRAYRHDKKQFISEVLAGVLRNPELTLTSDATVKNSKPPILDLKLLRQPRSGNKKEVVWMRLLFFRRYTIVASAAVPSKRVRKYERQAKRFTTSLVRWSRK